MHCFDIGDTFCAKSGAIKASHSDGFQLHVEAHKRHGFTMADLHLTGHDVDGPFGSGSLPPSCSWRR